MTFLVLEGFSGTGKTTLARHLEALGWLRLQESAHALPDNVPVADRGDTYSDYSLLGATLAYASTISTLRRVRDLVSEGYLLSDLAYAKVRFEMRKSSAYPAMLTVCREVLSNAEMKPDLYILLETRRDSLRSRNIGKKEIDVSGFSMTSYYSALEEIHKELGERNIENVYTDSDSEVTLKEVLAIIKKRDVLER